jgi:photosystem II stability/assembly factor-like uncharacterized protein
MKTIILILACLCQLLPVLPCKAQWTQLYGPLGIGGVNAVVVNGSDVYAGTNNGVYANGTQSGLNSLRVMALTVNGSNVLAGVDDNGGIYRSTNNGLNWAQSLNNVSVYSLLTNVNDIFAGTSSGSNAVIYKSTNGGITWTINWYGMAAGVFSLTSNGSNIFAGTGFCEKMQCWGNVYHSTNNGANWSATSLSANWFVASLAVNGNHVFAGCSFVEYPLWISTNNGLTWNQSNEFWDGLNSLEVKGTYIFAGAGGVYYTSNNGANWTNWSEGLGNLWVYSLHAAQNYLYAGTASGYVLRRPLSEIIVGVNKTNSEIPCEFRLHQNYPNPFNPVTNIKFETPLSPSEGGMQIVSLKIFDILGREVSTIFSSSWGRIGGAAYEASWDGTNYPSGVYFYKLASGEYSETKKMILIK